MNIVDRLSNVWHSLTATPETIVAMVTCVIIFAVLYFCLIKFLIGNNATWLVLLFTFIMILFGAVIGLMQTISGVVLLVVPAVLIIVVVSLYSVEIKRMVWAYKNLKLMDVKHSDGRSFDDEHTERVIAEIIKATLSLSKKNTGALIVLAAGDVPEQIIDSGVKVDANISSEIIESIFFPKTPLHDGAMIIRDDKIVAAGCFLPLSHKDNIPKDLGTRHRAGIGITETIDVVSLIVSEETGIISISKGGQITRYVDADMLKKNLKQYYWQELDRR